MSTAFSVSDSNPLEVLFQPIALSIFFSSRSVSRLSFAPFIKS